MWIVKLGGSLAYSENLQGWLRAFAAADSLVVVPGGGPFADQVRRIQDHHGFGHSAAHYMALLAMEQFGAMLCSLQSGLMPATAVSEMRAALKRGDTPVWMPAPMAMAAPEISHSWDVTSDSLSAWLCGRLGADALLLVKSLPCLEKTMQLDVLIERGIVDSRFDRYLQEVDCPAWLMFEQDFDRFEELLNGDRDAATWITRQPGKQSVPLLGN